VHARMKHEGTRRNDEDLVALARVTGLVVGGRFDDEVVRVDAAGLVAQVRDPISVTAASHTLRTRELLLSTRRDQSKLVRVHLGIRFVAEIDLTVPPVALCVPAEQHAVGGGKRNVSCLA
jgi:hypothetical protein